MKYIIMAGGNYNQFKKPKQLLEVNGEILIERTIRLLKENKVKDIAISTNNPAFNYLEIEKLKHENNFTYGDKPNTITSKNSWLNAYYPMKEPCCYLHGDVYYSEEAIKTIVNTKVKDTMFFCVRDLQDGRKVGINTKGREPLAYKVENQKIFRKAINELFEMIDKGLFKNGVEPISWHLYRQINGLELGYNAKDYGFANNIFETEGNYIVIDDYTTDVDNIKDISELEQLIKFMKGGLEMIKVEVTKRFHLGAYNKIKNIVRVGSDIPYELFVGDIFECDTDMAKYLLNETPNPANESFVRVIEVIPEKTQIKKVEETDKKEKQPKKTTIKKTTKKSVAKK